MTTAFRELRRAALLAMLGLMVLSRAAGAQSAPVEGVAIELRPDKRIYQLGEPVNLEVRIANRSSRAVAIPAAADVWVGHVEVFIASRSGDYAQYTGPGWGLHDVIGGGTRILEQGQEWTTPAVILYNHGLETRHLSPAARADLRGRLLDSGFAFRSPGAYRIKARLHGSGFTDVTESDAVEIVVTQPQGIDRTVWNALNSSPHAAYFLHTGGPKAHPLAATSLTTVEMLEQLASAYPSSRYAEGIRNRLDAFERTIERLRDRGLVTQ